VCGRRIVIGVLTVNVLALVGGDATNGKLSVGGLSSAITTRQIVDDQSGNLVARNILDCVLDDADLVTGVAINMLDLDRLQIEGRLTST
jgi:hypothetical protein